MWPKCCLIWQVFGPWASPYGANGQITMTLHNYRSRQVHETSNGVNPSSGFRDMRSAKSGPNLCQIGSRSFWPMGKWPWQCTTTGLDNSTELRTVKIHQAVTEIWVPQVWQPPARPRRQYPSSPQGWGVKRLMLTIFKFLLTVILDYCWSIWNLIAVILDNTSW